MLEMKWGGYRPFIFCDHWLAVDDEIDKWWEETQRVATRAWSGIKTALRESVVKMQADHAMKSVKQPSGHNKSYESESLKITSDVKEGNVKTANTFHSQRSSLWLFSTKVTDSNLGRDTLPPSNELPQRLHNFKALRSLYSWRRCISRAQAFR